MGIFIIIAVGLTFSIGVAVLTARSLRRFAANYWWWLIFALLSLGGLSVGVALSFWEHQVSPTIRMIGFPIPGVIFQLEDGQWTDYVHPFFVSVAIIVLNAALVAGGALMPLLAVAWVRARRSHMDITKHAA